MEESIIGVFLLTTFYFCPPLSIFSPKTVDSGNALPGMSMSPRGDGGPGRLELQVLGVQPPMSPLGPNRAAADFS